MFFIILWTLCILCSLRVKGFRSIPSTTASRGVSDGLASSLHSSSRNINEVDEDDYPTRSPLQIWIKKILLPARKFVTSTAILGTTLMPLKKSYASSSPVAKTSIISTRMQGNQREATLTRKTERSDVLPSNSFVRDAVRLVGPSVVRVDCEREVSPLMALFSPDYKEGDTSKVSGSGIVVSTDGYLLTNSHVVQSARSLTITLSNGRSFKATVVAFDELTDLAVLKADVGYYSLPNAPLGDSSSLQSGDWVIAVGCPVGLDFTVTLGIVSSPKRTAHEVGAINLRGTYIQTDAALNSGNSGGPLVDAYGHVVGINTMVRSNAEAVGFAIPINRAKQIYEILKSGKKPSHAYFGLEVMTLTPDFARIHNDDPNAQRLPEVHGAIVARVGPNSPAAACGFRKNDIIVEVNGDDVINSEDADMRLDKCKPGQNARIRVIRGEPSVSIELQAIPQDLLVIVEQKRLREAMITQMKPPSQQTQRRKM